VASSTLDVAANREDLRIDCRDAFRAWHEHLAEALRAAGAPDAVAADQAWTCVAALEGAVVLSRAERSAEPVRAVGRTLERVVGGQA
jgi:TetR/AcrR family transcriptional repressor of lmrAB and yxaGH operons